MSKKQFIALADAIRDNGTFTEQQIDLLAEFCRNQNPRFMRGRWKEYIAGNCGPNGGAIK